MRWADWGKAWAMFLLGYIQEIRIFLKGCSVSLCGVTVFFAEAVTAVECVKKSWERV